MRHHQNRDIISTIVELIHAYHQPHIYSLRHRYESSCRRVTHCWDVKNYVNRCGATLANNWPSCLKGSSATLHSTRDCWHSQAYQGACLEGASDDFGCRVPFAEGLVEGWYYAGYGTCRPGCSAMASTHDCKAAWVVGDCHPVDTDCSVGEQNVT